MKYFESVEDFKSFINGEGANKSIIIDFFAEWCGPCRGIAPFFSDLSEMYKNVVFAKVDVDNAEDVANFARVSSLPTFILVKNGAEVARFTGASKPSLENLVRKAL